MKDLAKEELKEREYQFICLHSNSAMQKGQN